jgi:hypothetical protein
MRIFKLVAAVGLLLSSAACAVYTRDYPSYGYGYHAYHYGPPAVVYYG